MRQQERISERGVTWIQSRLTLEDIQPGCCNSPALERYNEIVINDQSPASRVYHNCRRRQKSDGLRVQEVVRLFSLRGVQAEKLTRTEKFKWIGVEYRISHSLLRQLLRVRVMNLHPKGARATRDCPANSSHAQDAEYFTG